MPRNPQGEPTLRSYLEFLLSSPILAWWALATGVIEMVGFGLVRDTITLSKWWLLIIILVVSFSLLIAISALWKAWPLYSGTHERINVSQIVRIDDEQVFLLEGLRSSKVGSMFEIYRTTEDVEVSIGFIKVTHQSLFSAP